MCVHLGQRRVCMRVRSCVVALVPLQGLLLLAFEAMVAFPWQNILHKTMEGMLVLVIVTVRPAQGPDAVCLELLGVTWVSHLRCSAAKRQRRAQALVPGVLAAE